MACSTATGATGTDATATATGVTKEDSIAKGSTTTSSPKPSPKLYNPRRGLCPPKS